MFADDTDDEREEDTRFLLTKAARGVVIVLAERILPLREGKKAEECAM